MKSTIIWIESGKISHWLAEAIAGAYKNRIILDFDKISKEGMIEVVPQIREQPGTLVGVTEKPLALRRKFGGTVILPYGSKQNITMKGVIIYKAEGKKAERDKIVEKVLEYLKKEKKL